MNMSYCYLTVVIYSVLIYNPEHVECKCKPKGTFIERYKMRRPFTFKFLPAMSYYRCALECFLRKECLSFQIYVPDSTCSLNSNDLSANPNRLRDDGFLLSDINTWTFEQSDIGGCKTRPCPARTRCTLLKSGQYTCIQSECEQAPVPVNAKPIPQRGVGVLMKIRCDDFSILVGRIYEMECKPNGQWHSHKTEEMSCIL